MTAAGHNYIAKTMSPAVSAYIFAFIAFQLKFCLYSVDLCILLPIFCSSKPFCTWHRLCGMVGSTSILLPGTRTQLSEEEDCIAVVVCSAGDLHGHLEPRQKEGTTSRLVWQTSDRKNCRPKKKKKKSTYFCIVLICFLHSHCIILALNLNELHEITFCSEYRVSY